MEVQLQLLHEVVETGGAAGELLLHDSKHHIHIHLRASLQWSVPYLKITVSLLILLYSWLSSHRTHLRTPTWPEQSSTWHDQLIIQVATTVDENERLHLCSIQLSQFLHLSLSLPPSHSHRSRRHPVRPETHVVGVGRGTVLKNNLRWCHVCSVCAMSAVFTVQQALAVRNDGMSPLSPQSFVAGTSGSGGNEFG